MSTSVFADTIRLVCGFIKHCRLLYLVVVQDDTIIINLCSKAGCGYCNKREREMWLLHIAE